jgi:hypothetical protein
LLCGGLPPLFIPPHPGPRVPSFSYPGCYNFILLQAFKLPATSAVEYLAANLLEPPCTWRGAFNFVFEANTLQVLPAALRLRAIENIAGFLCPGGLLLAIARGREPSDPLGQMPWPVTRAELFAFMVAGLEELSFLDLLDLEDPAELPVRRFRVLYRAKSV